MRPFEEYGPPTPPNVEEEDDNKLRGPGGSISGTP
jgi:hypothetical protein